ncbi:MAG: DNA polymerase I, partial [Paludibacter sp.]
ISIFGLSERLSIPRAEAKELITGYFATYPKVKEYMEEAVEKAKEQGYVETIYGRKRYLKDINSGNSIVRGFAERNAINAPIQGSAADIIKLAMINIQQKLTEKKLPAKMIMQVHDELNFSVPSDILDEVETLVKTD